MLGKSHIKVALGMSIIFADINIILGAAIGSLLPDIDTRKSIAGRYNLLNRTSIFRKYVKHRGVTHSIRGLLCFSIITVILLDFMSAFGLILGYASHILADLFTLRGAQLFWPKKKRYRFAKINTGSIIEVVLSTLILISGILLWIWRFINV